MQNRVGGLAAVALLTTICSAKAAPKVTSNQANTACADAFDAGYRAVDDAVAHEKPKRVAEYAEASDKMLYSAMRLGSLGHFMILASLADEDKAACPADPAKGVEALRQDFSTMVTVIKQPVM